MFATCLVLGAWCLGGEKMWESKGNIYIHIFFSYFGMFSDYIHDFFFFFFFLLSVWVLRKCGKVKRNRLFFFGL